MQTIRTTISLPSQLVADFQKLVGEDKSFSEQIRLAITAYIAQEKHAHMVREMEVSYKKHAVIFEKSAAEHADFRDERTNHITSSL